MVFKRFKNTFNLAPQFARTLILCPLKLQRNVLKMIQQQPLFNTDFLHATVTFGRKHHSVRKYPNKDQMYE